MISLVICSKQGSLFSELSKNIEDSIGVEYELVLIDNSNGAYSIFSACEEGVKRAIYPIVCFMHEDILYRTKGWGRLVLDCFSDETVGLCGVIGSSLMLDVDSCWWSTEDAVGRVLQNVGGRTYETVFNECRMKGAPSVDVVTVDGVWFCIRKSLFDSIKFEEAGYGKWHGYDLDISMQVLQACYRCVVLSNMAVEHFSTGVLGKEWFWALSAFQKKWKAYLPIVRGLNLSEDEIVKRKVDLITSNSKIKELNGYLDYYRGHFGVRVLRLFHLIK